jgi:hypothetical protein
VASLIPFPVGISSLGSNCYYLRISANRADDTCRVPTDHFLNSILHFLWRPLRAPRPDTYHGFTNLVGIVHFESDPFTVINIHTGEYQDDFYGADLLTQLFPESGSTRDWVVLWNAVVRVLEPWDIVQVVN